MDGVIRGRMIVRGTAEGRLVLSRISISLWGGVDPETGIVIDRRHDRCGVDISGQIFAFPEEKGSSTASAVLVELIRNGHSPVAIVTRELAPIVALGSIVANELYRKSVPVVTLDAAGFNQLVDGTNLHIGTDGSIRMRAMREG